MKKVLITGASGDLGVSLVESLIAQDGICLGLHSNRHPERLNKFKPKSKSKRKNVYFFQGDLSTKKTCEKIVKDFVEKSGGIDVLIQLSGGVSEYVHWSKMTQSIWDRDLKVNLAGAFFLAQEASVHMQKKGGKIILTSTASASHGGGPNTLAYGIAKAGVECFTKRLAKDLAAYNITVNCIAAGFLLTEKRKQTFSEDIIRQRIETIPLRTCGEPVDFVNLVEFLISDKSKFITGEVITLSGGEWLNAIRW